MRILPIAAGIAFGAAVALTQACGVQPAKDHDKRADAAGTSSTQPPATTQLPVVVTTPARPGPAAPVTTAIGTSGDYGIATPGVTPVEQPLDRLPDVTSCDEARAFLSSAGLFVDGIHYVRTRGEQPFAQAAQACEALGYHLGDVGDAVRIEGLYHSGTLPCFEQVWARGNLPTDAMPVALNPAKLIFTRPNPDTPLGAICTDSPASAADAPDACAAAGDAQRALVKALSEENGACAVDADCLALEVAETSCATDYLPVAKASVTATMQAKLDELARTQWGTAGVCRNDHRAEPEACTAVYHPSQPACDQGTKLCKLVVP